MCETNILFRKKKKPPPRCCSFNTSADECLKWPFSHYISESGIHGSIDAKSLEVWTVDGALLCEVCQTLIHSGDSLAQ